ncbi:riboflavin biosynthesis protein RibF [Adlercreutzia sp. ZJ242]|uniref:riboflavin biosynthesis protein RibF n=1 Tax=Adlercreutzia sp. ZJ242 TaxID=2709409 RepID=UPI0013EAD9A9|nr:riboflavin biosynthesis protein RibF [Adlercreutzia sp. ZJ242]
MATYRAKDFDASLFAGASCAFGVFDGVHAGHRFIIGEAVRKARELGARAVVVTFDRDPDEVFAAGELRKLMSNEQRLQALCELEGVDDVVALAFTRDFAALEPEAFLERAFGGTHVPAALFVGRDFRFGARASGDVGVLERWGARHGMLVAPHDLLELDGAPVTATRIRGLLQEGAVGQAARLLGAPYRMAGVVQPGRGEGRDMGFRTANLHVPDELRALGDGVYAAYAHVGGMRYKAAVSVGVSPTFEGKALANVEAHILDFSGDLYGDVVELEFMSWLRPMMTFATLEDLISTVNGNIAWVRENL